MLANPKLAVNRRTAVASGYIWSKGLFQCGAWPNLHCNVYKKVHVAIMYVFRIILHSGGYAAGTTDDDVIAQLQVMCPLTMLRACRLCLFARFCKSITLYRCACELVDLKGTWAHAVMQDLQWLTIFREFRGCSGFSFGQWADVIRVDAKSFRKSCMTVCKSTFANVVTQWAVSPALQELGLLFECDACSAVFQSRQALSLHRFKLHGTKSITRRYIDGTQCPICLVEFWTRERAINHVRYRSVTCRLNLLMRPPELTQDQSEVMDAAECSANRILATKGLRRHAAQRPCVQLQGPLLPILVDTERVSNHHPLGVGHCWKT